MDTSCSDSVVFCQVATTAKGNQVRKPISLFVIIKGAIRYYVMHLQGLTEFFYRFLNRQLATLTGIVISFESLALLSFPVWAAMLAKCAINKGWMIFAGSVLSHAQLTTVFSVTIFRVIKFMLWNIKNLLAIKTSTLNLVSSPIGKAAIIGAKELRCTTLKLFIDFGLITLKFFSAKSTRQNDFTYYQAYMLASSRAIVIVNNNYLESSKFLAASVTTNNFPFMLFSAGPGAIDILSFLSMHSRIGTVKFFSAIVTSYRDGWFKPRTFLRAISLLAAERVKGIAASLTDFNY